MYSLESDPETFAGRLRTGGRVMGGGQEVDRRWLMEVVRDSPGKGEGKQGSLMFCQLWDLKL